MTKYVIDLPAAATVIVAKKQFLLNETDVMRVPVSQLEMYVEPTVAEDAPVEKRVIELPADEIKLLVEHKRGRSIFGFLHYLINETGDPSLITELTDELETAYISITQDVLAEWYLGHVEFVPKKGPKFYVEVELHDTSGNQQKGHIWQNDKHGEFTPYMDIDEPSTYYNHKEFTEQEADNIIEKLGGKKGLLKPWKVKVEE